MFNKMTMHIQYKSVNANIYIYIYIYCKKGIVIATDNLLFQIKVSEHNSLL